MQRCRSVENFTKLFKIEEGTYGVVYKAKDKVTGEIVALKMLKLDREEEGFPITALREIHTLKRCKHKNIVDLREVVVGKDRKSIFIVMEYVDTDLKTLLLQRKSASFSIKEIKLMMKQILEAAYEMHSNWIIHRDLKATNLLVTSNGEIKVADFGLARNFGSPLGSMTPLVVTLWYRSPELLLGQQKYSSAVDMWSIGCIFAELILNVPLFAGKSEIDQISKIIQTLGTPNEQIWPGYTKLPHSKMISIQQPYSYLKEKCKRIDEIGFDLLNKLLTYCPEKRITAEQALQHEFFNEIPTEC